jgi:AcrR family transcriptional regulator
MSRTSRKEAILIAATFLFANKGFNETAMTEVAKMAHIANATIFYHFKTKEDLFLSVLENVKKGIINAFEAYFEGKKFDTGLDMMMGAVSFYLYFAGMKEEYFLLLHHHHSYKLAEDNPICRNHLVDIYNCLVDIFERALLLGQQDGSVGAISARKTALIILSMVDGIVQFKHNNLYDAGALYNELMKLCRRMVETKQNK